MGTETALLIEQKKPINLPYSSAENPKKKTRFSTPIAGNNILIQRN